MSNGKYVGYIRVSTQKQADSGLSLEAQEEMLKKYADLYDMEFVEIVVDAGLSGTTLDRPGLQKCLAMMDNGEVDGMVVTKLCRLSRSAQHTANIVNTYFRDGEFNLHGVIDKLDTSSASGRLFVGIMSNFNQYEAEVISERTKLGLAALKGKPNVKLGPTKYGMVRDPDELVEGRMKLKTCAEEVATMERIVGLRKNDVSFREICRQLEADGIKTRRGKSTWNPGTVKKIYEGAIND